MKKKAAAIKTWGVILTILSGLLFLGCPEDVADPASISDNQASLGKADSGAESVSKIIKRVLKSYGLEKMTVKITSKMVKAQLENYPTTISFEDALKLAIESFLKDDSECESPLYLIKDNFEEEQECIQPQDVDRVKCYLNTPAAMLTLVENDDEKSTQGAYTVYPPENRESISTNWVFYLKADNLSDHLHWAIVARRPVYNYGFN